MSRAAAAVAADIGSVLRIPTSTGCSVAFASRLAALGVDLRDLRPVVQCRHLPPGPRASALGNALRETLALTNTSPEATAITAGTSSMSAQSFSK